jgi:putative hydrolase of the HAD superfamily
VSPIRAILFDADGVIQRGNAERFFGIAHQVFGPQREGFDEFMNDVFAAEHLPAIGQADFAETLAPVLKRWRCARGVDAFLVAWEHIDLLPGGLEAVAEMRRRGYMCCLATNQQAYRMRHMSEVLALGDHFDREFYSCAMGCRKPDTAYFQHIVHELRIEPRQALFIDDSQPNVDAAASLGIRAAFFPGGDLLSFVEQRL